MTVSAQILSLVLLDRVALYAFLSYLWPKFLLKWARPCKQGATLINKHCIIPSHRVKVAQFSVTFIYKNKYVILSCRTYPSNICLRSTSGVQYWRLACGSLSSLVGEVGGTARGCSIPLQKLKWLHHLSGLWSPLSAASRLITATQISVALPHFPMHAEEIPLAWQTGNCHGICITL